MTWKLTPTLLVAATLVAATLVAATFAAASTPLPPDARHENTSGDPVYVLLTLASGAAFANSTEHTFQVLDARQLRDLADAVADPEVLAHEAVIDQLEAQLTGLDAALEGLDARRAPPRSEP